MTTKREWGLKNSLSLLQTLLTNQLINKARNLFIAFLASHGITAELLYSLALMAAPSIQLVIPSKENGYWIVIAHSWPFFLLLVSVIPLKVCSCQENVIHTLQARICIYTYLLFFKVWSGIEMIKSQNISSKNMYRRYFYFQYWASLYTGTWDGP